MNHHQLERQAAICQILNSPSSLLIHSLWENETTAVTRKRLLIKLAKAFSSAKQ